MPIIDNVLIGAGPGGKFEYSALPCGDYFGGIIEKNVSERGDQIWMTDASTGKSMKYSELLVGIRRIASALCKKGFQVNDSVLFMASNHIELPLVFFGVWKAGGNAACLTLNLHSNDIRDRASENRTKFILTDEDRAPRVVEAVRGLDFVKEVFVIGQADGCTPVDELLQDDGQSCPVDLKVDVDSLAWLMYSSGTTGVPKGIVHTHRNLNAVIRNYTSIPMQNRKFLFINLMINGGGMGCALLGTVAHAHAVVMSSLSDDNLLKAIHENKPQLVSAFPSQIAWLCRHPDLDKFDVSSVSIFITSGSTINPIYERDIFDKLPNLLVLYIAYGLSETSLVTSNAPRPQELATLDKKAAIARHIIGSCGKVAPYCKVKVIDRDSGEVLGPGQVGEVVVHTPYLMKEYLNKPKETAETIRDGWCYTGDKGYYDEDENLFINGRYKELIKYRMAHVLPTNIEKHMMTHPAIEDCGVVGLPHDVHGELPLAFVVLRHGVHVTAEELIQYTNDRVIEEEKLRGGVRFIDKIPRNDFGKIVRPQLVKLL